jgi:hypothetical protein
LAQDSYQVDRFLLGELFLKEGLITENQLREALRLQAALDAYKPVGKILMDQGLLTSKQLNRVLDAYRKRPRLGILLLRARELDTQHLQRALELQKPSGLRLGEVLLKLKYITDEKLAQFLALQLNIPFVDLNSVWLHREMTTLIPKQYALRNKVLPIRRTENEVMVALGDPTDLGVIHELQLLTGLPINVAAAVPGQILQALGRIHGDKTRGAEDCKVNRKPKTF